MQKTTIEALNIGEQQGTLIEAHYFKVKTDSESNYLYLSDNILNINSKAPTGEPIEISDKKTSYLYLSGNILNINSKTPTGEPIEISDKKTSRNDNVGINMLFLILVFLISSAGLTRHAYIAWNEKNIYSDEKNKIIVEEIYKKKQEIKELKLKLHKE